MGAPTLALDVAEPCQTSASTDLLAKIHRRHIECALADAHLPPWPELMRGVPNGVLRTALFGAIKRGKRRYMEREPIASVKGVSVTYTGPRLDQSDLDVWEGALHLARSVKLGNRVEFTEKGFLRLIGRGGSNGHNIGKSNRVWLRKVLARLTATAIEITQGPYTYCGSLIDEYFRDSSNGRYVLILNPRIKVIFNHGGWTSVDWNIRHALIGHPLAQWLHGFYSTHAVPVPYKAETLHFLCGSEAGKNAQTSAERHKALLDWMGDSLVPAFSALKHRSDEAGQPFSWEISGDGLVFVSRTPSASQLKHVRSKAAGRQRKVDRIC
ncbi:Plasmid replication initiator protein TrfA [Paraburkholderia ultramafica]|uniref:Plasmid replication initiator protein TrfA n=1 Tax=Paraburkholderia ultramafica TaxID=1544867 RepID=A0A6S7B2P7_9BURK|nr:plasmid replication initiator TrfA [Paraburkholderia ultramafica]CAB3785878.1 Plasmid replication initiator protein TrfA [Paraburkholderia ultramafica]